MKKFLSLLMACAMVLCFTACGGTTEDGKVTEYDSLAELAEAADCAMITPADVELADEKFVIIEGEPQIAEYSFTVDGAECLLRFAKVDMDTDVETDISGIDNGEGKTLFEGSDEIDHYIENDDLKAQRWFTLDGEYVFVAKDGGEWDWSQFDEIQSQFASMEPRNWSSDVPYEDYLALVGTYADEDLNMAGVSIVQDHARIYVYTSDEDGAVISYRMDAVLEDGKLVYDSEIITKSVYDEDTGETNEESVGEGGAGYIEINDDSLVFAGAASEALRGLVLAPYSYE